MKANISKITLQNSCMRDLGSIYKNIFLLDNYEELSVFLNNIYKEYYSSFLYFNRARIEKILLDESEIVQVNNEDINFNGLKSLFYFSLAINHKKYVINYSYDLNFINDLYLKIKDEKGKLTKLFLYIIYYIIFENFKGISDLDDTLTSEENDQRTEEIENLITEQLKILKTFNLNISFDDDDVPDIEEIYIKIIISLIKDKKFDKFEYVSDIMQQLDTENIELTQKMLEELKKEFNDYSKKEYINSYKIKNFDSLNNEEIINFNFCLLKYIFKNDIYIYNIQFLLDSKKSIEMVFEYNFMKIKNLIITNSNNNSNEQDERKIFILKKFLNLEYYINLDEFVLLEEILKYFNQFLLSKKEEIKELEEIIKLKDKDRVDKYIFYYKISKRRNKRYKLLRFIYDSKNKTFNENSFLKKVVEPWENSYERSIHDKKYSKMKMKKEIFNFFSDENNRDYLLQIFKHEEIESFIKYYNLNSNINIVKIYYQNYFPESKREDIEKIESNKYESKINEYLNDLDLAKKMNNFYVFISKVFNLENKYKTEKEINEKLKEWENISKKLEEKKFDIDDEIKIRLIQFFNKENNKEKFRELLSEESFKFLKEQKEEIIKEIVNYYKIFFPETKKELIESIENGNINDEILEEYSFVKEMNLRKPFIFSLLDEEKQNDKNEKEINEAKEKWNSIENAIKNEQFDKIDIDTRNKIIKFFKNKDDDNFKFIKEIFNEAIIDKFVNDEFKKENKIEIEEQYKIEKDEKIYDKIEDDETRDKTGSKANKEMEKKEVLQNLSILLSLEQKKEIEIIKIKLNDIYIEKNKFDEWIKCNWGKKDKEEHKIIEFIEDFKEQLEIGYTNNFKLVLELYIERTNNNDFSCEYRFFDGKSSINYKSYSEFGLLKNISVSDGFEHLKKEINDKKYNISPKKTENVKTKEDEENDITLSKISKLPEDNKYFSKLANTYQVLLFIKVMGNHNENNSTYTAEFIREFKNHRLLSGGTNKSLKLYDEEFNEETQKEITEIKEWIYNTIEVESRPNYLEFIGCSTKEIYKFIDQVDFSFNTWELKLNKCYAFLQMDIKIKKEIQVVSKKKNKKKKNKSVETLEKIIRYHVIAGKGGVICLEDMFLDDPKMNHFYIIKDKTYRNVFKINESKIALTSNSVLFDGEDKLIIYDFSKNDNLSEEDKANGVIGKKEYEFYGSFISSNNGLEMASENVLLCACKKYLRGQKNGIYVVFINNYEESQFYETGKFEVNCFCPILKKVMKYSSKINENVDYYEKTDYFFVGGFDSKTREGKIKLYKLAREREQNKVNGIQFLQDIDIDHTDEITDKNNEEEQKPEKRYKFKGFNGAISCIIQSTKYYNIIASCYDGNIYLLSKPNLGAYNIKLYE